MWLNKTLIQRKSIVNSSTFWFSFKIKLIIIVTAVPSDFNDKFTVSHVHGDTVTTMF